LTFAGIWFVAYSEDHWPPHFHGEYAGVTVIVEIVDGEVRLATRRRRVKPANAKRSDVMRILKTAEQNADALIALWEKVHGEMDAYNN
jgi:hypothetical protein